MGTPEPAGTSATAGSAGTTTSSAWVPDWDGATYAANTGHHRVHDEWFLRAFPVRPTDHLLDLGCGSGDFTRRVAGLVPHGHVVGIDAQSSMVAEARRVAAANQSFVIGPLQQLDSLLADLPGAGERPRFDAVMSRAVLHWVPVEDHPALFAAVFRNLVPGGWLRVECGGAGNVAEVVAFLDAISAEHGGPSAPWNFSDAGRALDLVEAAGFTLDAPVDPTADLAAGPPIDGYVHTVAQHRSFDRDAIIGWLRSQAIEAYASGVPTDRRDSFRSAVIHAVDELRRRDGTYDLTYVRLDLLVHKPG